MDKDPQTKLVLERTIVGRDFSDLCGRINPVEVFSKFEDGQKKLRAEDVFKDPHPEPVQHGQPRRPVVVEVKRRRPPFEPKP